VLRDVLRHPTPEALHAFLVEHLHGGVLVSVAGECEVGYYGRAQSTADAGDYLTIVKSDGSVQVHGNKGYKPRNWQARTDELHADLDGGLVVLHAFRRSPEELLRVVFLRAALALALVMGDEQGFMLNGSEADMRQALARDPSAIEEGLVILHDELPVGVGSVDLYARDRQGRFVVVELKRARATQEAVHQLERYVQAVAAHVRQPVRGILVAPSITAPARAILERRKLEYRQVSVLPEAPALVEQPGLF
jgi:RecB family endonuclease NucS